MRLPAQLSRLNPKAYKNTFGHILIIAGSRSMLGAGALSSLAAMRTGAGLVTLGIPEGLTLAAYKKISPVVMTLPLKETRELSVSAAAFAQIKPKLSDFDVIAIGPGMSQNKSTQRFILNIIEKVHTPLVIDADALNALSKEISTLKKSKGVRVLTPHPGEMARLTGLTKKQIEQNRKKTALDFAKRYECTLVLKGYKTIVACDDHPVYINKTGNAGMATAGSGDVLTGMIASLLAQRLCGFDAAKYACFLHGKAGDLAAKKRTKASLVATDIIEQIPFAIRSLRK